LTLRSEADITEFESHRPSWKPTTEPLDTPSPRVATAESAAQA